jgi:alpha-N-arabinofuranosidase
MWMDWLAQGTHIHRNVCHRNETMDVFMEVDHGPFLIENNVFLSNTSQLINSQGGAYAHNLFCGEISLVQHEDRLTPFLKPHSTEIAALHGNPIGDMRFYNNLFAECGNLSAFNVSSLPMYLGGNVFLKGARPCIQELAPSIQPDFDPRIALVPSEAGLQCDITLDPAWSKQRGNRKLVTSEMLGTAEIPKLPFQLGDGSAISIDTDYSGQKRNPSNPFPGPFEISGSKPERLHVMLAPSKS